MDHGARYNLNETHWIDVLKGGAENVELELSDRDLPSASQLLVTVRFTGANVLFMFPDGTNKYFDFTEFTAAMRKATGRPF
jgi:hypothetical protein